MNVDTFGGPCPICGNEVCSMKYGDTGHFTFFACPECGFAIGGNASNLPETNGFISGSDLWEILFDNNNVTTLEKYKKELYSKYTESTEIEDPIWDFDAMSEKMLNLCVSHRAKKGKEIKK